MTTATNYIKENIQKGFKKEKDQDYDYKKIYTSKLIKFRNFKQAVTKIPKPTNIPRARSLGYKAKQGVVVTLVRVRKGSGLVRRPNRGRRPKRMGVNKITRRISIQRMAENKAEAKYPNLQVLNSYLVGEDGQKKYYEVILVDPDHPAIINDMDLNWICSEKHKGRARRGKTSAGKKNRGIKRAKGAEKNKPSLRANNRKAK
jgi:large subunit ribosomal protein L15e